MPAYPLGVTKSLSSWNFQNNHVERMLDNAPYDAAHPDDTLILSGPARKSVTTGGTSARTLFALGMFQSFGVNTSAQVMPLMAIGSGRSFFLRGKSQTSWQIQRALINGRNLLRALYHNAVEAGISTDKFDDPAAYTNKPKSLFFINLDSELFYIPFGLAVILRTKSHTLIAGMYLELSMINTWGTQIGAGQAVVAESVSGMSDRILPYLASDAMENPAVGRATMDAVLGLAANVFPEPMYNNYREDSDTGLGNQEVSGI